jgi:ABC-2 type transport system ATP-binding protein
MAANRTILLSTHILQEVEAVADRVILIDQGRVVFDGLPGEMQAGHPSLADAFHALTEGARTEGIHA